MLTTRGVARSVNLRHCVKFSQSCSIAACARAKLSLCVANKSTWLEHFYFNPKGKTKNARRRIPLSDRVLGILRTRMQSDLREGWLFPSSRAGSGHIELG